MKIRTLTNAVLAATATVLAACGTSTPSTNSAAKRAATATTPSVPPLVKPSNVYAADAAGNFSPTVRADPPLIYVPNSLSNTVDVINPPTFNALRRLQFRVTRRPQH